LKVRFRCVSTRFMSAVFMGKPLFLNLARTLENGSP
jgi:hypothetical protein